MQNILDVGLVALFAEWDIADMLNGVNSVIPSFYISRSVRLSELTEPILMTHHVVGCARVEKPYVVGPDADIEFALCLITNILP